MQHMELRSSCGMPSSSSSCSGQACFLEAQLLQLAASSSRPAQLLRLLSCMLQPCSVCMELLSGSQLKQFNICGTYVPQAGVNSNTLRSLRMYKVQQAKQSAGGRNGQEMSFEQVSINSSRVLVTSS
jgi:hypothetical protein